MKKIIRAIIAFVLIAGILILCFMGLNFGLAYKQSKQIEIYIGKEFEDKDIKSIVKEVTGNDRIIIQKVEVYEDMVSITASDFTQEEIEQINQKINEKYEIENTIDDVVVTQNSKVRGRDIIKPYILPVVITIVLTAIYAAIRYKKLKTWKVIAKVCGYPILVEAILLSIIAITRIPVTRLLLPIACVLYVITILVLFTKLEKKEILKENQEKKKA